MRAALGLVSLVIALAIVGLLTVRQLQAARHSPAVAASQAGIAMPNPEGTPAQQARQIEKQVGDDVTKALAEGAARAASADQ